MRASTQAVHKSPGIGLAETRLEHGSGKDGSNYPDDYFLNKKSNKKGKNSIVY